ncbi:MAG: hypothetical protein KME23_06705 [Goleter apudmare HA4340-LM2]|jgi:predicted RND superfamily exporter protein|nr:hypothetical protein [Goleter apudmare HA4340-LM2]
MKLKMNKKKVIISSAVIGVLLATTTLPSYAFGESLDINQTLDKVLGQLSGYFKGITAKLEKEITTGWGNLQKDALAALEDSQGDMEQPDPTKAAQKLAEKIKEKGGTFAETNTVIGAVEAGKELERATTRASVASVLSLEGQQRTKTQIDATKETTDNAQQLAEDAQNADSSQDVLKAIAAQNAQVVSMLGQMRTDGLQQRNDVQHTNLMLSQIAENGAEQNRTQRVITAGVTSQFLEISGWSRLDPSYIGNK